MYCVVILLILDLGWLSSLWLQSLQGKAFRAIGFTLRLFVCVCEREKQTKVDIQILNDHWNASYFHFMLYSHSFRWRSDNSDIINAPHLWNYIPVVELVIQIFQNLCLHSKTWQFIEQSKMPYLSHWQHNFFLQESIYWEAYVSLSLASAVSTTNCTEERYINKLHF